MKPDCLYTSILHSARKRFNTSQQLALKAAFANNLYLKPSTVIQLVKQTGLNEVKIRMCFKNHRKRQRKKRNFSCTDETGNDNINIQALINNSGL